MCRTDLAPDQPTVASPFFPCIALLPIFLSQLHREGKGLYQRRCRRTPPSQKLLSPRNQRSFKYISQLNTAHLKQNRRKRFQDEFSGGTQPFLPRALTMFSIGPIKVDASNGSIRVFDESPSDKVIQVIGDRSESDRFASERLVNLPRLGRADRKTTYVCASGRETFKPNSESSRPTSW